MGKKKGVNFTRPVKTHKIKGGPRGIKISTIKAAIKGTAGILSIVMENLRKAGIVLSRQALRERVIKSPELKRCMEEEEEGVIDMAEAQVISNIRKNDKPTLFWFLDRKGKKRGYFTKSEIEATGRDGTPLTGVFLCPAPMTAEEWEKMVAEQQKSILNKVPGQ